MTPRPFYRSRLYWLGLPGLLFLLWVWWDSGGNYSDFSGYERGSRIATVKIHHGCVQLWAHADKLTPSPTSLDFLFFRFQFQDRKFDLPVGLSWQIEKDEALGDDPAAAGWVPSPGAAFPKPELRGVEVSVALWFMVLVYLCGLSLTMLWWQRRKSRMMKLHTAS